jgi:putative membrane protein
MKLLLRWLITSVSLVVAAWLVPGIHVENDSWTSFALMALILGLINAFVRPVLKFLSCPLIILTLGFFILVINALTLWIASGIAGRLGVGYRVDSFGSAFFGALIVSVVSVILNALFVDEPKPAR